jgi:O-methyltransferase
MNTVITQDRLDALVRNAGLTPPGMIAECGVYRGGSLKLLAESFPERSCVGFDTFEGLPTAQWNKQEPHDPGYFSDTSIEDVRAFINLPNVKLVKGLFPESARHFNPAQFTFVHVDFDFYEGIKACIEFFWPFIPEGSIMMFDDFQWMMCPGVERAIREAGLKITMSAAYQAIVIK